MLFCCSSYLFFSDFANAAPQEYSIDLGAGLSALQIPHYPGSAQNDYLFVPFPFLRVRSPNLEIERNELTGTFFKGERVKIGLTLGGSLPVNSAKDKAREGMPDVNIGLEAGPSLSVLLWKPNAEHRLTFDIPVRQAVFFSKEKIDPHGQFALPHLHYLYEVETDKYRSHSIEVELGAEYATQKYSSYFYDVEPEFATAERPAYEAHGGLSAYRFTVGFSALEKHWYFGAFAKYLDLHDSVIDNSPLVKRDTCLYAGVAVAYLFDRFEVVF